MRVLIFGATGMLGHEACRVLSATHDVHGVCRRLEGIPQASRSCFDRCTLYEGFDAFDEPSIDAYFTRVQPDVVLNCIGVVKQLAEAKESILSIHINSLFPHLLARASDALGAKLIQISTDCIFSGQKGNYNESDRPDPVDLYGRSKLLGEVVENDHLTIRTSIIGRQLRGQSSLLEWFRNQQGQVVQGYGQAIFSGLTTSGLCDVIGRILSDFPSLSGLFHVSTTPISKLDLLMLINKTLNLGITIERDDSLVCDRSLDSSRFRQATGFEVPSYDEMIGKLKEEEQAYD